MIFSLQNIRDLISPPAKYNEALVTTIMNASLDALVTIDEKGAVLEWNKSAEQMFGFTRNEALNQDLSRLIIPLSYRAQHRYGLKRWIQNKTSNILNQRLEMKAINADGVEFPVEITIVPVETDKGYIFTAALRDLTEVHKERERRELIEREQKHRIKNLMTVVQSLAQQSFKENPALVAPFLSRIYSMSKTHDLLFAKSYEGANLKDIVETSIYAYEKDNNFRITGIPYEVPANAAVNFSLLIHELCTNAIKYGALSVEGGYVEITWASINGKLIWAWQEFKGPEVNPHPKLGFGHRLITRAFTGEGESTIEFDPKGLKCTLSLVLGTD